MSTYEFGLDVLNDVLFRAGEPTDRTSEYESAAKDYISRVLWDVYTYYPWSWAKKYPPGVLQTVAKVTGAAAVTSGSTSVTLSATVAASLTNRKFVMDDQVVPYRVASHAAGSASLTLDAAYAEDTNGAGAYTVFQDEYQLLTGANGAIHPFSFWFRNRPQWMLSFVSEEELKETPWRFSSTNVLYAIALITETRVRIKPWTDVIATIEYDYAERQSVLNFTGAGSGDTPAVPREDRHVLSDWALFYLLTDKKDPDAGTHLVMAKNKLESMQAKYFPSSRGRLWLRPRQAVAHGVR